MKSIYLKFIFLLAACLFVHKAEAQATSWQPEVTILNYDQLKALYTRNDSVLYVVNFWGTYCSPCVAELPEFRAVNNELKGNPKFKMMLVSIDYITTLNKVVKPFLKKNNITPDTYLLDDNQRMDFWIPDIDPDWSGTIPATLIIKNGKKIFFAQQQMTREKLEELIVPNL